MGVINQEAGINMCILLRIKEITDKVLLYSTGNYTQYFVITYEGKVPEKRIHTHKHTYTYIYIYV